MLESKVKPDLITKNNVHRASPYRIEVTALHKAVDNLILDKVDDVKERSSINMSNLFLHSNTNSTEHERSNSLNKLEKNSKSDL